MCMEDIQIGRASRSVFRQLVLASGLQVLWTADPTRVSAVVTWHESSDKVTIGPKGVVDADIGIVLGQTFDLIWTGNLRDYGQSLTLAWDCVNSGLPGGTIMIIESFLDAQTSTQLPVPLPRSRERGG